MTHDHSHHTLDTDSGMPFEKKLAAILEHWIRHNDDHAATYRDWAHQAGRHRLDAVSGILEEAARLTDTISKRLGEATGLIHK